MAFELLLLLSFLFLYFWSRSILNGPKSSRLVTNWPLFSMLRGILRNAHRVHDFATDVLEENRCTFIVKGPCFANLDMLLTCDPANINHILSKNFSNYPKGPDFKKIFEILGDGILNSESELWEFHRKTTMSLMHNAKFQNFLERTSWHTVEKVLVPVLERASELGSEVELQELFQRFAFDATCILTLGYDPSSLAIDLPLKTFDDAEEAVLFRHILPKSCWKLQKWLQIGKEKKLSKAAEVFDNFFAHCISLKREELLKRETTSSVLEDQERDSDLLTSYMEVMCKERRDATGNFLKDTFLSLLFAGRDTVSAALTWFFWLLARNPLVEAKIREEIRTKLHFKKDETWRYFNVEELNKLVYLHGALCEALRLFPPVPIQHKAPLQPDILPSGHRIDSNTKTLLFFYSIGRMESIWGKDCLEFKPERWISESGGIKHVPSFKFAVFNAGPRSCLGKQMSFIQMKIIATTVIPNYQVEVVEGHPISPNISVVLTMKHGLKVKVTKGSMRERVAQGD